VDEIDAAEPSRTGWSAVDGSDVTIRVSGSGVDMARDAILHSEHTTPAGVIRRLTEVVRLDGDLRGYVLYQPTQVLHAAENRLVITGANVFSGTVAGSEPITMRSDLSRFDVDLATGEETGRVHLTGEDDAVPGPWYECDLAVVGSGQTRDGNPTFDYHGVCTRHGRRFRSSLERKEQSSCEHNQCE
jgi:hypothetical protein